MRSFYCANDGADGVDGDAQDQRSSHSAAVEGLTRTDTPDEGGNMGSHRHWDFGKFAVVGRKVRDSVPVDCMVDIPDSAWAAKVVGLSKSSIEASRSERKNSSAEVGPLACQMTSLSASPRVCKVAAQELGVTVIAAVEVGIALVTEAAGMERVAVEGKFVMGVVRGVVVSTRRTDTALARRSLEADCSMMLQPLFCDCRICIVVCWAKTEANLQQVTKSEMTLRLGERSGG
jgi:hypothetical protein